ncbi:MAG: hypothetical protein WCO60_14495 [Verrucomicrobiota bacterium]
MAILLNKIILQALSVLSITLASASAKVVAAVRIELTAVHLHERVDRAANLSGFVKATKDAGVGVMSLAKAQVLLTKTQGTDLWELGTVKISSARPTVVEKIHQDVHELEG